ncbi:MAG: TerC family protein [Thermoleophilia bacterium]|nr:TerC family protein [Thermoleophilia bacterium]
MSVLSQFLIWGGFVAFIGALLALDLFVFHREPKEVSFKSAAWLSAFWITLGVAFGGVVWWWKGSTSAGEYYAGYVIEKSLSMDNVFVFALLFSAFAVPAVLQHRVLFWGVVGALVFRAAFIFAGVALLERFHWMVYIFGGFLVATGVKLLFTDHGKGDPHKSRVLALTRRLVPVTDDYRGHHFLVREKGALIATPLLLVLVAVETTDLIFALDSIPAILAVTTDTFIVFSANAFAILGLRSLYFCLAGMLDRFVYLRVGLAAILVFAGGKLIWSGVAGKVPVLLSLAVILTILVVSIVASLIRTRGPKPPSIPARS